MARRDPRTAHALAITLLLACAGSADAAPKRSLSRFDEGVQSLRLGDYPAAVEAFRASYRQKPDAATVCNLALAYERWRDHDQEALDAYQTCAKDDTTGNLRRHAVERIAALRGRLAGATTPAPTATAAPAAAGPAAGPTDSAPAHQETAAAPEDARARALTTATLPTPARPRRSHALLWGGVAVSAVALGVLGGAIGVGEQARQIADSLPGTPVIVAGSSAESDLQDARTKKTTAIALYATGSVCAALGISLIVADLVRRPRAAAYRARFEIMPTAGGGRAALTLTLP